MSILGTSSLLSSSVIYQSGDTAILPCDISVPNNPQDELVLVMWYREDARTPIYSIGKHFSLVRVDFTIVQIYS